MDTAEKNTYSVALAASLSLHVLLAIMVLMNFGKAHSFASGIIYSVTLEGGKQLGGVAQVARSNAETPVAPPKNVSTDSEETKPDKKDVEEKAPDPDKDAEVSLAEKQKIEELKKKEEEKKQREEEAKKKADEKKKADQKKKEEDEKKKKEEAKKKAAAQPADISKDYQKALQRYLGESTEAGGKGFGAAKIGGKGMGGGVLMPPEFFTYRQILRNKVKSGWNWFNTSAALNTWVTFSVAADGTISDIAVAESSGNREYDESVLRALHKASPLPPPPASIYEHFKSVKMSFDPRE